MLSKVLVKEPGRYLGWPTACRAPDGTVHVVYCGDRDAHVCPFGKTFHISSKDDGRTWSRPVLVAETPLDDRDAGLTVCPDGTLVAGIWTSHYQDYRPAFERFFLRHRSEDPGAEARWAAWQEATARVTPDVLREWAPSYETPDGPDISKRWLGFWTVRSQDGGATWDAPARAPVYCPHGPVALPDGDLIFVGMKALTRKDGDRNIGVARSCDQGRTWTMLADVASFPKYRGRMLDGFCRLGEPHVGVCQSGKLVAMARYEETRDPQDPYRSMLWQFESVDGGSTWTEPHQTPIVGKPPFLLGLRNGDLMVTYGYRHPPFGQRACISTDEGRTWKTDREIIIRADAPNGDLGYPAAVECADGTILSFYYQVENAGEMPALMMTRIPLEHRTGGAHEADNARVSRLSEPADPFTMTQAR